MKSREVSRLNYDVILSAKNGDKEAINLIYEYYEPYIIKLSKIPVCNERGESVYIIKEELYLMLRAKLYELIDKFQIE